MFVMVAHTLKKKILDTTLTDQFLGVLSVKFQFRILTWENKLLKVWSILDALQCCLNFKISFCKSYLRRSVNKVVEGNVQRWKKIVAAVPPPLLIFHSCASFWFLHVIFKGICIFVFFILGIFACFCTILRLFAYILCAHFSGSKFSLCYFVSFFHLWQSSDLVVLSLNLIIITRLLAYKGWI